MNTTHVLITYDDESYYISANQALLAANKRDDEKTIQFKNYPGVVIMPGNIKSIGPKKNEKQGYGPHGLTATLVDVFKLSTGTQEKSFWKNIYTQNALRGKEGKKHIFADALYEYSRLNGLSRKVVLDNIEEVLEAISNQPEEWLQKFNIAHVLPEGESDKPLWDSLDAKHSNPTLDSDDRGMPGMFKPDSELDLQ